MQKQHIVQRVQTCSNQNLKVKQNLKRHFTTTDIDVNIDKDEYKTTLWKMAR